MSWAVQASDVNIWCLVKNDFYLKMYFTHKLYLRQESINSILENVCLSILIKDDGNFDLL